MNRRQAFGMAAIGGTAFAAGYVHPSCRADGPEVAGMVAVPDPAADRVAALIAEHAAVQAHMGLAADERDEIELGRVPNSPAVRDRHCLYTAIADGCLDRLGEIEAEIAGIPAETPDLLRMKAMLCARVHRGMLPDDALFRSLFRDLGVMAAYAEARAS